MTIGKHSTPSTPTDTATLLCRQLLSMTCADLVPEPDTNHVSLRGLVEALFRHQLIFVRVFVTVIVATVVVTSVTPKAYESRMKILVQTGQRNASITPEKAERVTTNDAVTEEEVNSEVELIDSSDLLQSVSKKLESRPTEPGQYEKVVRDLEKNLKINPIRKSNVIEVDYLDRSPERATHVLQVIAAEYLDKHLRLQVLPGPMISSAVRRTATWNNWRRRRRGWQSLRNPRTLLGWPRKRGSRGRQRVADHFTIEQTARRVESVYADVLG